MDSNDLRKRLKEFSVRIVRLSAALPENMEGRILGGQLIRSGTSIGANYCEALRASSRKQFVDSLQVCLREADETNYWLELIQECELIKPSRLTMLRKECGELIAILSATIKTTKMKKIGVRHFVFKSSSNLKS